MRHDGTGIAALIKAHEVTKQEVADAALNVIGALNPHLNAVIETWPEEVEVGGQDPDAPYAGVPFLIKDILIQRRGRRSEMAAVWARAMSPRRTRT